MAQALVKSADSKQPAPLKVAEGRHIPKGLAEIKALMSDTTRTPGYVFNAVLNDQQRKIVCFAAGLKQRHVEMSFYKFNIQERNAVHKALLALQSIVAAFDDANVLMPEKFERTQPKFDVIPHLVEKSKTDSQTH
ncbi:hypothetical protein H5158_00130 [Pseudoalteromonas sp. SR45-6]|uniref:hypothetical protein n=1 Tax=Pseudoalteromonas sp. SR45-6 TaxID=2760927 RepID=UPI00160425C4|nr:hypothetical protein [Pseudoalteromonas sp. SR45-6]MBB1340039.1 hypothetical protein [Pseudoalteromonas sp. SR45-6]